MNKDSGSLYHLSESNLDGKILTPKVPSNFLIDNGFEDNKTKRVCFSTTIDGALAGLSKNLKNKEFFVHKMVGDTIIKVPSEKEVPDVKITHERWALTNVKVKCVGKIKVGEVKDKPLTYKYGNKTAELYYWNWKWIDNDEEVAESVNHRNIKILNGYTVKDIQDFFDSIPKSDKGSGGQTHKDYKETIYRNMVPKKGWIELYRLKDDPNTASVAIDVHPDYRRHGVGKKLVKGAIAVMPKLDINRIEWYCNKDNTASIALSKSCGFNIDDKLSSKDTYVLYYGDKVVNESVILDDKPIFHNKDKWDNGEINIIFITGHSGSAKSTTGSKMATESYSLDDVIEQYRFTDENFKEYGDLIYSYFKGPGKQYRMSLEDMQKNTTEKTYEIPILEKFIDYAVKYAKSHKDKKFCIEGIQLFQWFEPSRFKDYPVMILGTSILKSNHRASKRDAQDANSSLKKAAVYTKNMLDPRHYSGYLDDEKYLKKWRDYYKDDIVTESLVTAIDDVISKAEAKSSYNKDYKDMMKLDGIRHPNKVADKVLKTSDKVVDKTMKALDKPASVINSGANKAIHKTVGSGISFYNKFAKKKVEAEKKRDIEAKAGVAVKGAAFMATKLIPMGPIDWTLNLIAVTKVPKSDDPIDKEIQKVANKAKDTLTDFRKEIKHYAEEDRKYATAKQQIKDLERIEGKYEPVTKKLALAMDNAMKKKEDTKNNINVGKLKPAYESVIDISVYTDKFDSILLSSSGNLLESSYDLLYDFIYEDGNENYPIYEIVNHYLSF